MNYQLTIDNIDYTQYLTLGIKYEEDLTEELDTGVIELAQCPVKQFQPFSVVVVTITDAFNNTKLIRRVVSADEAIATPPNIPSVQKYNHTIQVIEETKFLENFIVDSLTYTNALSRVYTSNPHIVAYTHKEEWKDIGDWQDVLPQNYRLKVTTQGESCCVTPISSNYEYTFISSNSAIEWVDPLYPDQISDLVQTVSVIDNSTNLVVGSTSDPTASLRLQLPVGNYKVVYSGTYVEYPGAYDERYEIVFDNIEAVENEDPLPKWTITSVINRALELAEPLREGETPRFALNATQSAEFAEIEAPEFAFTKATLREVLNEIGNHIHAISRLDGSDGTLTIYYDMLGSTEMSDLKNKPYVAEIISSNCEEYCTDLDSSVDNLVSMLDPSEGAISDPYYEGYKTVRTETVYARIEDGNMFIPTDCEIIYVTSLIMAYTDKNINGRVGDINQFVYEIDNYNGKLSSYDETYPTSKAYGLFYTQGQKNIYGLNFKNPDVTGGVFSRYAIVNIYNAVRGTNENKLDYPTMAFQVTYVCKSSARCSQTKSYIGDRHTPRTRVYNQAENIIESRYFGENLKGLIAKLGNESIVKTYNFTDLTDIPKAGTLYDDDYYITTVTTEYLADLIICTVGLSKDYNRKSQYIGLQSQRRYYEVSEKQAYNRDILYREYVVIGDSIPSYSNDTMLGDNARSAIKDVFLQENSYKSLSCIDIQGFTEIDGAPDTSNPLQRCILPAITKSLGNAILLTIRYADNYSAGGQSSYHKNEDTHLEGYFVDNVQYTDYYGRIDYLGFDFRQKWTTPANYSEQTTIGTKLPAVTGNYGTDGGGWIGTKKPTEKLLRVRKDNREILSLNYSLNFVTNRQKMIVGSALARLNSMVRGSDSTMKAKLYLFDKRLPKLDAVISTANKIAEYELSDADFTAVTGGAFRFRKTVGANAQSWAILVPAKDAEGNTRTGYGEILLGENTAVSNGDTIEFFISPKHKVFD